MNADSPTRFLSVGLMLQYVIQLGMDNLECSATLLGWKDETFLISELPYAKGRGIQLKPHVPCVVHYLLDGNMIGYRTAIRSVQLEPEPLLFLQFPVRIEQIILRKSPRVVLNQPVLLAQMENQGVRINGLMKDLSIAGCRVEVPGFMPNVALAGAVQLHFTLPGIGRISHLTGLIKNMAQYPDKLVLGLEFQFQQMEFIEFYGWGETVKKAIERFVAQRQNLTDMSGVRGNGTVF